MHDNHSYSIVTTNENTARDQHVIYDVKNKYNKWIQNTVTITESVTGFLDTPGVGDKVDQPTR